MIEGKFAQLRGRKLHYVSFGEGDDVIFLHGWGGDISAFLFVARRLEGHRVTLPDFAGFGESPASDTPMTVRDYAQDVLELMDALGIKKAALVGHSFGGRVCMQLAFDHPDRVSKLALVDSAGLRPRRGAKYYIKVLTHKLLRRLGASGLKGSDDYKKLSPVMKQTFKNVVNYDETPLLKFIKCPTAVFWGDADRETPFYMAKKLKAGIEDSEIFMLRGGHFAYSEDIGTFFVILSAFLK